MFIRLLGIACMSFFLSACSFLSPVKVTPPNQYMITGGSEKSEAKVNKKSSAVILVSAPDVAPMYNTTRMAYVTSPYQMHYFSQNEWAENPGQMMQPLLVAMLEKTGRYRAVVLPPYSGKYDYMLNTQLLRFQQNLYQGAAAFEIVMRAQLIDMNDNKVVVSKTVSIVRPVNYKTPYDAVLAANQGTAEILRQLSVLLR